MQTKNNVRPQDQSSPTTNEQKINETTSEQLKELKMMFDYFDTDKSGALDTQELCKLIEMVAGSGITQQQKLDFMAELDQDGNGKAEYEQFQSLFRRKLMKSNFNQEMQHAFKLIDIGQTSYITLQELQRICNQLNMDFTREDIELMMQKGSQADPGPNKQKEKGKVFFQQFVQMMKQK